MENFFIPSFKEGSWKLLEFAKKGLGRTSLVKEHPLELKWNEDGAYQMSIFYLNEAIKDDRVEFDCSLPQPTEEGYGVWAHQVIVMEAIPERPGEYNYSPTPLPTCYKVVKVLSSAWVIKPEGKHGRDDSF